MVVVVWKPILDGCTKVDHRKDGDDPVWVTHVVVDYKWSVVAALDWLLSHPAFTSVNKLNTILVPQLQLGAGNVEKMKLVKAVR